MKNSWNKDMIFFAIGAIACIGFLVWSSLLRRTPESDITQRSASQPHGQVSTDSRSQSTTSPPTRSFRLSQDERHHLIENNPFQIATVPPSPSPPPATPPPAEPPRQPPTPHRLSLVGTIFSTEGGYAIIRDETDRSEGFFPPGRAINERAILVSVGRNEAIVQIDEREERLLIAWDGSPPPQASSTVAQTPEQAPRQPSPPSSTISTDAEVTSVAIARDDLDQNFRNLSQLLTQMRVQPYFQDGKPSGFLISSVSRGSFVERLGARSGDVIREVNGRPIDSVRTAFELYNTFRNDDSVRITITRGGSPQILDFAVQ